MNGRTLTVLTALAGFLALGEFGSSRMIWRENYPGSLPEAAVVFGVFFLIADTLSFAFVLAAIAVVGAVITLAVPGNRTGWLLLAAGVVMGIGVAFTEAGIYGVVTAPGSVPGAAYLAALGPALQTAGLLIAVIGVPVVFPDGRLPGPRWRWLA